MALINCPECGKENISDSAPTCPECGFEIKKHIQKETNKASKEEFSKKSQKVIPKIIVGILVIVIIICIGYVIKNAVESSKPREVYSTEQLIECFSDLSDRITKDFIPGRSMTLDDCKNYFQTKGYKYQLKKNGTTGSITLYDNNDCYLRVVTWDDSISGVYYVKNVDGGFQMYTALNSIVTNEKRDGVKSYCVSSDGSFKNQIILSNKEEQIAWFMEKLAE